MPEENPHKITDEMIDDILVAAFEGGVNYWCANADAKDGVWPEEAEFASDVPSRGGTVVLTYIDPDDADPDAGPLEIDRAAIVKGIREAAKARKLTPWEFYEDHDSTDGDAAVQYAVFGQLVFG